MDGIRKLTALFVVAAATSLLFVVICPVTPTPIAVTGSHAPDAAQCRVSGDHGFQLNPVVALIATTLQGLPAPAGSARHSDEHPSQADVIDLVCSRLC